MEYRGGREKNIEKERFDISMVNRRINGFFFFSFFFREIYQRDGKINQECNNGKKILFVTEASKLESRAS